MRENCRKNNYPQKYLISAAYYPLQTKLGTKNYATTRHLLLKVWYASYLFCILIHINEDKWMKGINVEKW